MKHLSKSLPVKRITPADGHYFFGYYDIQPYSRDESLYLTHKSDFRDRLQIRGDSVQVGFIDLKTEKYEYIDTTNCWNFQQGAMLQWNPCASDREVIYNTLIDDEQHGVIMDIYTGKKRYLDCPVANISKDGKYSLSINMSRLYNFRPGYGYAWPEDPFYYKKHPKEDGIFLTDMSSGKSDLVLSLDEIWNFTGSYFSSDQKIVINHVTFNPSATRFIALVRNFGEKGSGHKTALVTANRDGSDMYVLSDFSGQSHYWWLDDEHIIIYCCAAELECSKGGYNNYILKDKTHQGEMYADGYFYFDNHMSFSPDKKYMVADSYPYLSFENGMIFHPDISRCNHSTIMIYSPEKNVCTDIGYFYNMPRSVVDVRCDLHPRWNRSGDSITFDSTHEGFRGIYRIEIPDNVDDILFR